MPSYKYSGPMKPTTVLTSSGANSRATAYARASQVCCVDPVMRVADSALPWPVSKYMTLSPERAALQRKRCSWASRSSARLIRNERFAASVPAIDWNTRSTGAPAAISCCVVVTCDSTQLCVGMS